jgi:hypothetical protein
MNAMAYDYVAIELTEHNSSGESGSIIKPRKAWVFRQSKRASQSCLHSHNSALLKFSAQALRGFSLAALRALLSRNHTGADKCGRFTDKPSGKNCWCTRIHKQADKVTLAFSSRYERLIIRICTSIIQDGLRMVGNLSLACPIH